MIRIEGEVAKPVTLDFAALSKLPRQVPDLAALIPGKDGGAVRLRALLDAAGATPAAAFATLASSDGKFAVSVPLAAIADNAVIAYRLGSDPLPASKGGPARFYVIDVKACGTGAGVDACANVKGLGTIRLTKEREPEIGHSH